MSSRFSVNYLYFGFLFTVLALLHAFHVFLIQESSTLSQYYFLTYALGQCFIEVFLLMWIASWIRARHPKLFSFSFVLLSFVLVLSQLIDFPLVRLMDMSIWWGIDCVTDESLNNFIEMLQASNVSLMTWLLSGIGAIMLLGFGVFSFYFLEKFSSKKKIYLSPMGALKTVSLTLVVLMVLDIETTPYFTSSTIASYEKALPWKRTLFSPTFLAYNLPANLKPDSRPKLSLDAAWKEATKKRSTQTASASSMPVVEIATDLDQSFPDLFLFVVESLRADFITPEVSPHLHALKQESIAPSISFANANATQISWFSIFNSKFPFYFSAADHPTKKEGSLPLSILKKLGYKIHVYSSARLSFYEMDELIFGKGMHLADEFQFFHEDPLLEAHHSDAACFKQLQQEIASSNKNGGRLFIIFLDSTHFEYSWPGTMPPRFSPFPKEMNFLKIACAQECVEGIKNRYRNAIYYLDLLFGEFITTLKTKNQWDKSIMVLTGDHGEEFYEKGHIFHATELSNVQTRVPIFFKTSKNQSVASTKFSDMSSHVDIFPTLLHLILGNNQLGHYFQGESIFKENKWPYTVVARYNGARHPCEFFIHNGTYKLLAKFRDEKGIFKCRELDILSAKNFEDEVIPCSPKWIKQEFGGAFESLFPPNPY